MKKFLLLTFVASLFAAGSAFAHCGACGASEEAPHDHSHAEKACCGTDGECCKDKAECAAKCAKACSSEGKCCGTDGKCCKKDKCASCGCSEKCDKKAKCCGTDGKCCKEAKGCGCSEKCEKKAKCCGEDGKCCKEESKDETATVAPPACCPASKPA